METVTCPADDCDKSGPKKSILGHYSGTQDDAHKGGYQKAKSLLEGSGDDNSNSSSSETGGSNPTMDSGNSGGSSSSSSVELPCGHESFDPSGMDLPAHATCDTCGRTWEVDE